jgi:hypothetical protein
MTIIFPTNNLPTSSQPWAREVQKQLSNVITSNNSELINNTARDNQTNSSIIALSGVVGSVSLVANQAAQAIAGLTGLGITGSGYTLNANNIDGGTMTGVTLRTAASGRRVIISGTSSSFYDNSGVFTGEITSSGSSGSSALLLTNVKNGGWGSSATTRISLNQTSIVLDTATSGAFGAVSVTIGGHGLDVSGRITCSALFVQNAGLPAIFEGAVSAFSVDGGDGTFNSALRSSNIPNFGVGAAGFSVFATSTEGRLGYSTSSKDTKEEIQKVDFDVQKILQVNPKSFKYKVDIEEYGIENAQTTVGFIAEDLDELGLSKFVRYNEDGKPIAIPYERYVVALQAVVRNLNNRIETLENGA